MNDARLVSEEILDKLRAELEEKKNAGEMSEKRFNHTVEVEKMAQRLGEMYAPDKLPVLRAAALLHDITKECSFDEQIALCVRYGIELSELDCHAPKTLHARTAAAMIEGEYPQLADREIIDCVRWHTTGRAQMTLCEKLIYLADYIDMSRKFEDCVTLRSFFFDAEPEKMTAEEKEAHLDDTMLMSYDMTIRGLLEKGTPISPDTIAARNEVALARLKRKGR